MHFELLAHYRLYVFICFKLIFAKELQGTLRDPQTLGYVWVQDTHWQWTNFYRHIYCGILRFAVISLFFTFLHTALNLSYICKYFPYLT